METWAHGCSFCGCRDARTLCHRADAQSGPDDSGHIHKTSRHWKIGQKVRRLFGGLGSASNAMGWQWSSGSGPDATPYFRVLTETQLLKFDPKRSIFTGGLQSCLPPHRQVQKISKAIPKHWNLSSNMGYGAPIVNMSLGAPVRLKLIKTEAFRDKYAFDLDQWAEKFAQILCPSL